MQWLPFVIGVGLGAAIDIKFHTNWGLLVSFAGGLVSGASRAT